MKNINEKVQKALAVEPELFVAQTEDFYRSVAQEVISGKRKDFSLSEDDKKKISDAVRGDTENFQMDCGQYASSVAMGWEKKFERWNKSIIQ